MLWQAEPGGAEDGVGVLAAVGADAGSSDPQAPGDGQVRAEPLTDAEFSAAVAAVTGAFGDPTRRQIYLFVREHDDGATASAVATRFNLHPNVARHHLDKLAAGGYLEVFVPRPGGGAGRPSKRYRVSGRTTGLELPHRSEDLLVILLGRALALLPTEQAEAMAEQVGEDYGRSLAARMGDGAQQRSFRSALHAVAEALTAHGFAAHAEAKEGTVALIRDSCPFFDTAKQHPVICAVDRGMVRGMLSGLYGKEVPATESSRALGDAACATFV
jgi:predicted ArsR family transcriptional regulator